MAEEYSDDEFAVDDSDGLAYEAEFDADDDDNVEEDTREENQAEQPPDTATQEPLQPPIEAEHAEEEKEKKREEKEEEEESYADDDDEFENINFPVAVVVVDTHDDKQEKNDRAAATPTGPPHETQDADQDTARDQTPVQPSAPPQPATAVSVLPAHPIDSADASENVAGRTRSSSLTQIAALPQIEMSRDAELQAKLTCRSSSPRMRPTPVARLASLGELTASATEELQVPTNELTEEAAAAVSAAAANDVGVAGAAGMLVKRPSAMGLFVPRLPSLREISLESSAALEELGRGAGRGEENEEKEEDDEEEEDEEEKNEEEEEEESEEIKPQESKNKEEHEEIEGKEDADAYTKDADDASYSDDDHEVDGTDTRPRETEKDGATVYVEPTGSSEDKDAMAVSTRADHSQWQGDVPPSEETSGAAQLQLQQPSRATTDDTIGLFDQIMADVARKDGDEDSADDDAALEDEGNNGGNHDLDVEDDVLDQSRNETRQLLHEAQLIITQEETRGNGGGDGNPVVDAHDQTRYDDEDDLFADDHDGCDGGGDGGDPPATGMQYDSDYEELGLEEPEDPDDGGDDGGSGAGSAASKPDEHGAPTESKNEERIAIATSALSEAFTHDQPSVEPPRSAIHPTLPQENTAAPPQTRASRANDGAHPPVERRSDIASAAAATPVSPSATKASPSGEPKRRSLSQGSTRTLSKPLPPSREPSVRPPPSRKPEIPKFTPKAPTPRQQRQPQHRPAAAAPVVAASTAAVERRPEPNKATSVSSSRPAKSDGGLATPSSPPSLSSAALPRKAPVYKQPRATKIASPEPQHKKLQPVKCPANLRIDFPAHVDREKREWLLLNMFRHGDDVAKYEAFLPTSSTSQHRVHAAVASVDCATGATATRPLSARQICGPNETSDPHGSYGRHAGRRLVNPPAQVDPRLQARERSWVATTACASTIPSYDSILDKYCKTVTSPVVQRRIYETREFDLSPQLAFVLEKRAFKEWKLGEREHSTTSASVGFGAVSTSYKPAIVAQPPSSTTESTTSLRHTPRPPPPPSSSSSSSSTSFSLSSSATAT